MIINGSIYMLGGFGYDDELVIEDVKMQITRKPDRIENNVRIPQGGTLKIFITKPKANLFDRLAEYEIRSDTEGQTHRFKISQFEPFMEQHEDHLAIKIA